MWNKAGDKSSGLSGVKCDTECGFNVKEVRYRDFFSTVKTVYQREGLTAFSKGIFPRMFINVPSTALSWGTYEIVKTFLSNSFE